MVVVFKLLKKWCDFFETFIVHSANHNYIQVKRFPRKCFIICQHIKEPDKWCINYTFFFSFSSHKTRLAQSKALLTCTCEHNFMLFFQVSSHHLKIKMTLCLWSTTDYFIFTEKKKRKKKIERSNQIDHMIDCCWWKNRNEIERGLAKGKINSKLMIVANKLRLNK